MKKEFILIENWQGLRQQRKVLERCSYGQYKSIKGHYKFPEFELVIDCVQGDPLAVPGRIRVGLTRGMASFPAE